MTNYEQLAQELEKYIATLPLHIRQRKTTFLLVKSAAAIRELCKSNKAKDAQIAELQEKLDAANEMLRLGQFLTSDNKEFDIVTTSLAALEGE